MLCTILSGNVDIGNIVRYNGRMKGGKSMKNQYHHGNLKHDLIEFAIQTISEEGPERLSLRNISKQCGVSHNAIYRHFASKDELVAACQNYVTECLTDYLTQAIEGKDETEPETLSVLSYAYVTFFQEHPTYFRFLYHSTAPCKIIFTMEDIEGNYPPFELFRKLSVALATRYNMTKEAGLKRLVKYWAVMEGIVSMMISTVVELDGDWKDYLENIFD